jgi:hypothetical protein
VHYIAIAKVFELRRSPRAQISQAIAAVDDHRPPLVEGLFRMVQELRKRQMNRTAYRGSSMLMIGKHVDHLAALGHYVQNITMIDGSHDQILLLRAAIRVSSASAI